MATPQEEATQIFSDVVRDLSGTTPDLKSALRRCQHACTLVDWSPGREWFERELNGYPAGVPCPSHRIGPGVIRWTPRIGSPYKLMRAALDDALSDDDKGNNTVTPTQVEFRGDIDGLLAGRNGDYTEKTGRTVPRYNATIGEYILEEVRVFPARTYHTMVKAIEGYTYNFASLSYRTLRYGNALTDIWTAYRVGADAALQKLGMTNHLDAIQAGLRSDNPESWRNAVYGCRNALDDLALHLWRDERPTYDHLPGKGKGGKLAVEKGKTQNRLASYLHQKGVTGTVGEFLRDEVDRLEASLRALHKTASTAHATMTIDRARTVALSTYFLIGELGQRTDMQPIETYGAPATPDATADD